MRIYLLLLVIVLQLFGCNITKKELVEKPSFQKNRNYYFDDIFFLNLNRDDLINKENFKENFKSFDGKPIVEFFGYENFETIIYQIESFSLVNDKEAIIFGIYQINRDLELWSETVYFGIKKDGFFQLNEEISSRKNYFEDPIFKVNKSSVINNSCIISFDDTDTNYYTFDVSNNLNNKCSETLNLSKILKEYNLRNLNILEVNLPFFEYELPKIINDINEEKISGKFIENLKISEKNNLLFLLSTIGNTKKVVAYLFEDQKVIDEFEVGSVVRGSEDQIIFYRRGVVKINSNEIIINTVDTRGQKVEKRF